MRRDDPPSRGLARDYCRPRAGTCCLLTASAERPIRVPRGDHCDILTQHDDTYIVECVFEYAMILEEMADVFFHFVETRTYATLLHERCVGPVVCQHSVRIT